MKTINKNIIMIALFFLFIMIILTGASYAASFTATASSTSIKVGDTVTITVKADNAAGMYKVSVDDSSVLSISSGSASEFLENNSQKIIFKAKKAGTAKITATPSDMTDLDDSSKAVTSGSKTFTIKVTDSSSNASSSNTNDSNNNNTPTAPTTSTKSSNAYLSTLGVTPKEYDFSGFSKTKTSYSVTVPSTVDSLKVVAKVADSKATVKVSGNSGFEVGSNNTIKVVVTAEDGKTTKTYTIKVTKLAEDEEKPGNVIEDDKVLYLTSLSIEGLEISPEFAKDTYSYTATLSDSSVNEVKVNAVANKEKAKIDISGNTNLVEGENTINLVLTLDGSTEKTVYQIVLTKEGESLVATTTKIENTPTSNNDLMGTIKKYVGIAIAVIVLVILAIIVLIILLRRENKRLKEEDNIDDDDNEEYNVYKNDVNEFENNENLEKENFIESLYNQRNETELDEQDKQTIDEINKQTEEIFKEKKVEGQSVEYGTNEFGDENPLEERQRRRGKHF